MSDEEYDDLSNVPCDEKFIDESNSPANRLNQLGKNSPIRNGYFNSSVMYETQMKK